MTAEEFLNRPKLMERRIGRMMEDLQELKLRAENCTPSYGGDTVQHSRNVDGVFVLVMRIRDAEARLDAEIDRLVDTKREILSMIRRIGNREIEAVLEAISIDDLSMGKAAEKLSISKHAVWNRYHRGEEIIEAMIKEDKYA